MSEQKSPKAQAREIIEALPESASWDDVLYELYVRESIEAGLADVAAGSTFSHDEVKARLREVVRPQLERGDPLADLPLLRLPRGTAATLVNDDRGEP